MAYGWRSTCGPWQIGWLLGPVARSPRLMRPSGHEWPVGLSRLLADAGTLMHYAMGESVFIVAGLPPELMGRAVLVVVQDSVVRGASPDIVFRVGAPLFS